MNNLDALMDKKWNRLAKRLPYGMQWLVESAKLYEWYERTSTPAQRRTQARGTSHTTVADQRLCAGVGVWITPLGDEGR